MVDTRKLTLTYFHIGGRGEPIRLAAAIGKIPFTHKAISFGAWSEVKPTVPLGQLPVLEIEAEGQQKLTIVQSVAILRYFGKLGGLYPEDPVLALKVDSIMNTVSEMAAPIEMTIDGAVRRMISEEEWTTEQKLAIRVRIATSEKRGLPFFLAYLENVLKENGSGWFVGDKVTIADLHAHGIQNWIAMGVLDGIPKSILDQYPLLQAHFAKVEAIPEVVEWRKAYSAPYTDFEFMG